MQHSTGEDSAMKKVLLPLALLALGGCASLQPSVDKKPELAKNDGYFVTAEQAAARGGIGNYVPRTPEVKAEKAKPVASLFHYDTNSAAIPSDETAKLDQVVHELKD